MKSNKRTLRDKKKASKILDILLCKIAKANSRILVQNEAWWLRGK